MPSVTAAAGGSSFPDWKTLAAMVLAACLGAGVSLTVVHFTKPRTPAVPPKPHNPEFTILALEYWPQLGKAYAAAWQTGAQALDAGQPVSAALEQVAHSWETGRQALYDQYLTPRFQKILPQNTADSAVTPAQRAALAQAWRGLALGLEK